MINWRRDQKLVQTTNHLGIGNLSSGQTNLRRKIYLRSATLLTFLFCLAILAALGAAPAEKLTPSIASVNSEQLNPVPTGQTNAPTPLTTADPNTTAGTTGNSSNSATTIVVNGKTVNISGNGSYSQTTTNGNDTTSVDVNHSSSSQSGQNNSSLNVDINSSSDGG